MVELEAAVAMLAEILLLLRETKINRMKCNYDFHATHTTQSHQYATAPTHMQFLNIKISLRRVGGKKISGKKILAMSPYLNGAWNQIRILFKFPLQRFSSHHI